MCYRLPSRRRLQLVCKCKIFESLKLVFYFPLRHPKFGGGDVDPVRVLIENSGIRMFFRQPFFFLFSPFWGDPCDKKFDRAITGKRLSAEITVGFVSSNPQRGTL